jgi:membrane protein DedA with SNARE-associated domain
LNEIVAFLNHAALRLTGDTLRNWDYWTYFVLAALVAVEGPIATLLGAAAASAGMMRPGLVFLSAALGNLTADTLWYTLGYLGKTDWIHSIGRRLRIRESLIEHLKQNMIAQATKVLFLAKLTVSFVIPSLIAAGLLRVPWRRWFPTLLVAETLWTGSLVLIGFYTTEAMKSVQEGVEYAILGASLLFVVLVIFEGRRLIKQLDKDTTKPGEIHLP